MLFFLDPELIFFHAKTFQLYDTLRNSLARLSILRYKRKIRGFFSCETGISGKTRTHVLSKAPESGVPTYRFESKDWLYHFH